MGEVRDLNIKNWTYYYFDIIDIKKLYLIFHSATGYFKENNGKNYLILDPIEKYEEVFPRIKSKIETINSGEELCYKKHYAKIGVNTDDDVTLNKQLKFPTLIIIVRCVFQKDKELDPLIYLNECLYEL